jgi:hypothetical protein
MSDPKEISYKNPFDAFNDGCDVVLKTLEEFMEEMDQTEGMYEAKYSKIKRMVIAMRASVGTRDEEKPEIAVPSTQIILPN